MQPFTVERSIWIEAPPERVWRAVTDPAQLAQWYAPGCPWEIPALTPGAMVKFYNTPTDVQVAALEAVQPPSLLTLRWAADAEHPAAALVTTFRLEAEAGGTRVTIHEAGYAPLPPEVRPARVDQAAQGYAASLAALKALLEG
jgi:uncharacterized protein YndB with AHSA1/START domain